MLKRVNDFHPIPRSMGDEFLLYLAAYLGSYFCAVQSIFFFIIEKRRFGKSGSAANGSSTQECTSDRQPIKNNTTTIA